MRGVRFLLTRIAYLLHRLKIVDLKKKLVV
jgi:hypothetical protein